MSSKKSKSNPEHLVRVNGEIETLWKDAIKARLHSHSPYSAYAVGAALRTMDGEVYLGCNVENASYGGTICAERVAILKAVSEGHKAFSDIVVVLETTDKVGPCALCLQTMAEFVAPDFRIWVGTPERLTCGFKFSELLPVPFGPKYLL